MIDVTGLVAPPASVNAGDGTRKVLHWQKNERMGGMVPVWEKADASEKLSQAAPLDAPGSFESALAYADADIPRTAPEDEAFGFGDLLDMVNPLQHLPIVGYLYRELTGDDIKPVAKIVGGGLYGGFAGAAVGLVDTAITYETGKSLTGNVVLFVTDGDGPSYRSSLDAPEQRLNEAVRMAGDSPATLPPAAMGFAVPSSTHSTQEPVTRLSPALIPLLQERDRYNS